MSVYDRFGYPIESGSAGLPALITRSATFSGGGSALVAPLSFPLIVPQDCEIVKVVVLTEGGPGDCVLDILKAPFGSYPPTASICASDLPTITAGIDYMDLTLTGWTTALDADDTLLVNLTTTDTFTQITLTLYLQTLVGGDDTAGLVVTDGVTTVTDVVSIQVVGGTVTEISPGNVEITFSGGGSATLPWQTFCPLIAPFEAANNAVTVTDSQGRTWNQFPGTSAVISTTEAMFGSSSLYAAGSGGNFACATIDPDLFMPNEFTIECWIWPTTLSDYWGIIGNALGTSSTGGDCEWFWYWDHVAGKLTLYASPPNTNIQPSASMTAALTINTWHHVAICRNRMGVISMFIDGSMFPTETTLGQPFQSATKPVFVGNCNSSLLPTTSPLYIDEVRFITGYAKYTNNFTPPAAPFTVPTLFPQTDPYN